MAPANGNQATRVKMIALRFGAAAGTSGEIYHTNPKGSDERAREPMVREEDVKVLETRGLAELFDRDKHATRSAAAPAAKAGARSVGPRGGGRSATPAAGSALAGESGGDAPGSTVAAADTKAKKSSSKPGPKPGAKKAAKAAKPAPAAAAGGDGLSATDPDAPPIAS